MFGFCDCDILFIFEFLYMFCFIWSGFILRGLFVFVLFCILFVFSDLCFFLLGRKGLGVLVVFGIVVVVFWGCIFFVFLGLWVLFVVFVGDMEMLFFMFLVVEDMVV